MLTTSKNKIMSERGGLYGNERRQYTHNKPLRYELCYGARKECYDMLKLLWQDEIYVQWVDLSRKR